jgi:hypothetical protein
MDTVVQLRNDDPKRISLAAVLAAWPSDSDGPITYSTAELIQAADEFDGVGARQRPELYEALRRLCADQRGVLSPDRLGNWLRDHKGVFADGRKLSRLGSSTRPKWTVEV